MCLLIESLLRWDKIVVTQRPNTSADQTNLCFLSLLLASIYSYKKITWSITLKLTSTEMESKVLVFVFVFTYGFFLKVWRPRHLAFATSILRIYRNNNAQYKSTPVSLSSERFISITLGVFIGQRSSGSISSTVQAGKFQFTNNIRHLAGIWNHTPQARRVTDKRHWQ